MKQAFPSSKKLQAMKGSFGSNSFRSWKILLYLNLIATCCFALQTGEICSSTSQCDSGLQCDSCTASGRTQSRCTRIIPLNPASKVKGLPFNKYSWLTTHNSFALLGAKSLLDSPLITEFNQEDSITSQLSNGVRGLMLDMYDFNDDIWLCHSFGGKCYNFTAFQPAINVLKEVEQFLAANPSEIITIFIEDYVQSPNGLSNLFNSSGLNRFWFPVKRMPTDGSDWPILDDMVSKNQRLVVFTSKRGKEAMEGIAYNWKYVVENQYGDEGMVAGSCPNRAESVGLDTRNVSLFLVNYFPSNPNGSSACVDNSGALIDMVGTCQRAAQRWPNFIAVDFYKRSEGGGAPAAVDKANGKLTCGCDSVAYCVDNAPFGTCNVPKVSPTQQPPAKELNPVITRNDTSDAVAKLLVIGFLPPVFVATSLLVLIF